MSAPDTNIEAQKRKHKGSLAGMASAVVFAMGLLVFLMAYIAGQGGAPRGADVQIDGRTGAEVPADN